MKPALLSRYIRQLKPAPALDELPRNERIRAQLALLDRQAGCGREVREAVLAQTAAIDALLARTLPNATPVRLTESVARLKQLEEQAQLLRAQLQ